MIYQELERRKRFLEGLHHMVDESISDGKYPPLNLTTEDMNKLGIGASLDQNQAEYLFITLVREGFVDGEVIRPKNGPLLGAFLQGLTDKGHRLISILPPDENVQAIVEALNRLVVQIENSNDDPQDKDRKSRAVQRLTDTLVRTASEVGSTGLGKALAEGMFGQ